MKMKQLLKAGFSILLASAMMITSVPATSQAAPEGVVDTVYGEDPVTSLTPGYYLTVYSKTTLSYASANTATGANLDQEAQSVYMAVSTDGKNFEVLNSGGGVIFSKNYAGGTLKVTNPRVYKEGNGFIVEAQDATASKGMHVFTSTDGVHYYDDTVVASSERSSVPLDKTQFTLMLNGSNLLETDATITLGNALELTEQEYKRIVDKLGTVVNTGLESLPDLSVLPTETVTQATLESRYPSVNATYSDGSTQKFIIDWTDALKNVDLTKPGEYPVKGQVVQPQYLNNLKALNNSELPEDDPENIGGADFPDNVDPENKVVYYDKTKFIEGMADPFIYWDEVNKKYYMTASYFPEDSDADRLEGDKPDQYDRVVLRCGETLEDLQKRENQITIWKVGNQGFEDNDTNASRGYRYIWAPEIHRVGNNWVVYFTESHSSNEYNIYCHALVLDGSIDPYTTALKGAKEMSEWEDHKMRVHEDYAEEVSKTQIGDPFSRSFCLDMTYFKDEKNGQSYVSWAGKPTAAFQGGNTDLFIAKVDEDEPWKITSAATRLTCPEYGWERISYCVNEGSTVLQHDGNIFLCYSASGTGSEYSIGMLTAKNGEDLLDISKWTKNPYPLLASRDVNGEEGPGHNSFTVDKDGNAIFVYHARPTSHNYKLCGYSSNPLNDACRHARLKRVHWAADGTPILKMTYEDELKDENKTVSLKIKVQAPNINLDKTTLTLEAGKSDTLTVTPAGTAVTWSSNNDSVAKVTNGKVTAGKKTGTATITAATADGRTATCTVKVVSLSKTKLTMKIGESATLKVNGASKVTWTSSKKANVTVSSKGKVTAKKAGKVTITAKADGVDLKCTVTVKKAPTKVKATVSGKSKVTLKKNKTYKIKVSMSPKGSDSVLKYSTSSKKVATVDSKGKIKAKKKGKATITVKTANNKKATIKVTVK